MWELEAPGHVDTCLPLDPPLQTDQLILQLRPHFVKAPCDIGSRDSSVGVAYRLWTERSGVRILAVERKCSVLHIGQTVFRHTQSPLQCQLFFRSKLAFMAWKRTDVLFFAFTILISFSHLRLVLLSSLLSCVFRLTFSVHSSSPPWVLYFLFFLFFMADNYPS